MTKIGYVTAFLVLAVFAVLWPGYAFSVLWGWFFVPSLGLPTLSIAESIGVALVVQYLTHQTDSQKDTEKDTGDYDELLYKAFIQSATKPALALLMGSIIKLWV